MIQIVRQTWQERYESAMKLPKEELARMLAESAKYTNPDGCAEFAYEDNCGKNTTATTDNGSGFTDDCFIFWR